MFLSLAPWNHCLGPHFPSSSSPLTIVFFQSLEPRPLMLNVFCEFVNIVFVSLCAPLCMRCLVILCEWSDLIGGGISTVGLGGDVVGAVVVPMACLMCSHVGLAAPTLPEKACFCVEEPAKRRWSSPSAGRRSTARRRRTKKRGACG